MLIFFRCPNFITPNIKMYGNVIKLKKIITEMNKITYIFFTNSNFFMNDNHSKKKKSRTKRNSERSILVAFNHQTQFDVR